MPLDRFGSVFVVFREPATERTPCRPRRLRSQTLAELGGPWQVAFQPDRGAPATATFDRLTDFRDNSDPGIRYFSGIATYIKEVQLPAQSLGAEGNLWLDLGQVYDLAEVWVNGKLAGTAWKPPIASISASAVVAGMNRIEIKSVNLWVNRLIGDVQPGVTRKFTFTAADGKVAPAAGPGRGGADQPCPTGRMHHSAHPGSSVRSRWFVSASYEQ